MYDDEYGDIKWDAFYLMWILFEDNNMDELLSVMADEWDDVYVQDYMLVEQ
tara:strand:- start:380 stop:532 length:153 start_codon:yes stop_codon:yes gene_type:complete